MIYNKITVEHNHGILELVNAEVFIDNGYRYIRGTCVGGGQTSRLFHAHSYRAFETGKLTEWCIGSSTIYGNDTDGYRVSAVFV